MADSNCIFCQIVKKTAPADILFENHEIAIFKDIRPAALHHYLCIPKEHIPNVNDLRGPDHKRLLDTLVQEGKKVLEEQGGDPNDVRMGFHVPPFNTVNHLHLHMISPSSSMSLLHRVMFRADSFWFASVDRIIEKLKLTFEN